MGHASQSSLGQEIAKLLHEDIQQVDPFVMKGTDAHWCQSGSFPCKVLYQSRVLMMQAV